VRRRCPWAEGSPLLAAYHDQEWGLPERSDRRLFEFLILEGAQAGLSWETILKKREGYRRAFASFRPEKVARFGRSEVTRLLKDDGIVRNRLKIESTIENARLFLEVQRERGTFADYLWDFAPEGKRAPRSPKEVPAKTAESDALSRELKKRGFRFVGSTIVYAYMQATGLVNDHLASCFRRSEVGIDRGGRRKDRGR
jgi:DNA-3-methyladenine glycosylase I